MKIFEITENLKAICEYKNRRGGFKHEAILLKNNNEVSKAKCLYINRTLECYDFQSVLYKLLKNSSFLEEEEKEIFKRKIENGFREEAEAEVEATNNLMKNMIAIGNLITEDREEKIKFQEKMLIARGLTLPSDWQELSIEVKEARIKAVLENL